jgi:hypothetical protein
MQLLPATPYGWSCPATQQQQQEEQQQRNLEAWPNRSWQTCAKLGQTYVYRVLADSRSTPVHTCPSYTLRYSQILRLSLVYHTQDSKSINPLAQRKLKASAIHGVATYLIIIGVHNYRSLMAEGWYGKV